MESLRTFGIFDIFKKVPVPPIKNAGESYVDGEYNYDVQKESINKNSAARAHNYRAEMIWFGTGLLGFAVIFSGFIYYIATE